MNIKTILLFIACLLPATCLLAENNQISNYQNFIAEQKNKAELIKAIYKKDIEEIGIQAKRQAQAPAIENYIQTLKTGTQHQQAILLTGNQAQHQTQAFIFLSSSMPQNSLTQWFYQADRLSIPIVLQGLIQDSMLETKKWIKTQLELAGGKGGIQIDPIAYETYGIAQVPAVVIVSHPPDCAPNQSCLPPDFDVVYGNMGLNSALQIMAEKGGMTTKTTAADFLSRIKQS